MTAGEEVYLVLVIVSFTTFGLTLAAGWLYERSGEKSRNK